jgi:hypothetical protein
VRIQLAQCKQRAFMNDNGALACDKCARPASGAGRQTRVSGGGD